MITFPAGGKSTAVDEKFKESFVKMRRGLRVTELVRLSFAIISNRGNRP